MKINFKKMYSNYCEAFEAYSKIMTAYYTSYVPSEHNSKKNSK